MAGSAAALSLIAILRWLGRPGTGLLVLVFLVSIAVAWSDIRRLRAGSEDNKCTRADDRTANDLPTAVDSSGGEEPSPQNMI
jgi:hypothetical protein